MKITLKVKKGKAAFFLELLKSFDFITIEDAQDMDDVVLSEEHKAILDQRLANYKSDPNALLNWDEVKKDLEEGL